MHCVSCGNEIRKFSVLNINDHRLCLDCSMKLIEAYSTPQPEPINIRELPRDTKITVTVDALIDLFNNGVACKEPIVKGVVH